LSAGGSIAAALARRGRDGLAPHVAAHFLICPVLDHDLERPSYELFGDGLNLTHADMAWFWDMYLPDRLARDQSDASPLRAASLDGLAPAIVLIAGADVLRDEAVAYCERLCACGVDVHWQVVTGVPHGLVANPEIAAAATPLAEALAELRTVLSIGKATKSS
jgi:acetyl esterase